MEAVVLTIAMWLEKEKGSLEKEKVFLRVVQLSLNSVLYLVYIKFGSCFLKCYFIFILYSFVPLNCRKCASISYSKNNILDSINVNIPV